MRRRLEAGDAMSERQRGERTQDEGMMLDGTTEERELVPSAAKSRRAPVLCGLSAWREVWTGVLPAVGQRRWHGSARRTSRHRIHVINYSLYSPPVPR